MQIRSSDLSAIRPLYTADSVGGNPATANVRSGTIYGPSNELTGTLAVPPAGSVALGVPVDNTTGTAAITAANIRSAVGLASANLDAQLAAIPTTAAPTAAAVASAVWAAATRTLTTTIPAASDIAAAVWSAVTRTITGGTVDTLTNAPSVPSAAAIASQVRTELTPELANLDASVSSRLPSSSYTTPPTAAAIATAAWSAATRTLTSNPAPSAADNATAVRQELATELARIDAAISSRLAPNGTLARVTLTDTATTLTNAPTVPTPSQIADAVRDELTPELSRVANCATVETTGAQIAAFE